LRNDGTVNMLAILIAPFAIELLQQFPAAINRAVCNVLVYAYFGKCGRIDRRVFS
jgi:hypothetical protein